jgi:hypothetical protein
VADEIGAPTRPHIKVKRSAVLVTVVALLMAPAGARANPFPPERDSPPGQLYVWAGNVRQQLIVDLHAFKRLLGLVRAVRSRPAAFDGGSAEATAMPDVMIFNEMRPTNAEILRRLLLQRSKYQYEIIEVEGAADKMVYNADKMTPQGLPQTILDPCRSAGENARTYLLQRFTENASGQVVTVVGVHFKARYNETGQPRCRENNVQTVKTALTADVGPVVVGGDFNKRPVEVEGACDPNEESPSLEWYQMMVAPADLSRAFTDTVRHVHRRDGISMAGEWTFERLAESNICTGARTYKRSRLDYIFVAGAEVADAHADHPGWAEDEPGAVRFGGDRYSDHRWVTARLILSTLPRVSVPDVDLQAGGRVQVTWEPVEGATSYAVYRATRGLSFTKLAEVAADQTTFIDRGEHGVPYRYAVAALAADATQGRESSGVRAIPDARGPRVSATNPPKGAPSVDPRKRVRVWFGEGIDGSSISESTIQIFRKGSKVAGRIRIESARQISFDPANPLRKGSSFYVIVRPVLDRLGNDGPRHTFSFSTPAPPKKGGKKG